MFAQTCAHVPLQERLSALPQFRDPGSSPRGTEPLGLIAHRGQVGSDPKSEGRGTQEAHLPGESSPRPRGVCPTERGVSTRGGTLIPGLPGVLGVLRSLGKKAGHADLELQAKQWDS